MSAVEHVDACAVGASARTRATLADVGDEEGPAARLRDSTCVTGSRPQP